MNLIAVIIMAALTSSCTSEAEQGQFRIINNTGNKYNVSVDGYGVSRSIDLAGFQTTDLTLPNNMYNVDVLQLDGYLLYPTRAELTVYISYGSTTTLELPDKVY